MTGDHNCGCAVGRLDELNPTQPNKRNGFNLLEEKEAVEDGFGLRHSATRGKLWHLAACVTPPPCDITGFLPLHPTNHLTTRLCTVLRRESEGERVRAREKVFCQWGMAT